MNEQKILKEIKKLKIKLYSVVAVLVIAIIFSIFIASGFSVKQWALALVNSYNKVEGNSLSSLEWNQLLSDFVKKEGDAMLGDLNMGGNRLSGLINPQQDSEAVNRGFLNAQVANLISRSNNGEFMPQGSWCGISSCNYGDYNAIFDLNDRASNFEIPCLGVNVSTGCPDGFTGVSFRFTANTSDNTSDEITTCIKN